MTSSALSAASLVLSVLSVWAPPALGPEQAPAGTSPQPSAATPAPVAPHPHLTAIAAVEAPAVDEWDQRITRMVRNRELTLRETLPDALVAGRTHQRYLQLYKGVPVVGGDVSRQLDNRKTVSVFGSVYGDITIDPVPKLTPDDAAALFQKLAGSSLGPSRPPDLVVLPTDDGGYRLTYRARITTTDDVILAFLDATTGETVMSASDLQRP